MLYQLGVPYWMLNSSIDGFLKRSFRYWFTGKLLTIEPILNSAVEDLFCKTQLTNHCLHPLLPPDETFSHSQGDMHFSCLHAGIIYIRNPLSLVVCLSFQPDCVFRDVWLLSTIAVLPLSILYFDIYVCYMFHKITYLLTYLICIRYECIPVVVVVNGRYYWVTGRSRRRTGGELYLRHQVNTEHIQRWPASSEGLHKQNTSRSEGCQLSWRADRLHWTWNMLQWTLRVWHRYVCCSTHVNVH